MVDVAAAEVATDSLVEVEGVFEDDDVNSLALDELDISVVMALG